MSVDIRVGDVRDVLPTLDAGSVQLCLTSPPYFALRDYQTAQWEGGDAECDHAERELRRGVNLAQSPASTRGGAKKAAKVGWLPYRDICGKCGATRIDRQIGSEPTPDEFVATMVGVFREVRRVLRDDGCLVLNLGTSYAGSGKGPTGKNGIGNQAKRQGFVGGAATSDRNQSRGLGRAPAYGSDDTARSGSRRLDSSCFDLCDGCLADFLTHRGRTADTLPQPRLDGLPLSPTVRDSELLDSSPEIRDASVLGAPASTTLESWLLLRGECSRCASRAASFARLGLPKGGHATQESTHGMADPSVPRLPSDAMQDQPEHIEDIASTVGASVRHNQDTSSDFSSCLYSNTVDRHWKSKDLMLIPFMVAEALRQDGWYLRSVIPWVKKNPMPESVQDRPATAIEYLFLFSKKARYYWDGEAVRREHAPKSLTHRGGGKAGGHPDHQDAVGKVASGNWGAWDKARIIDPAGRAFRNSDPFFDSWQGLWCDEDGDPLALVVNPAALKEAHFASFPPKLVEPFVRAATSERGCCPTCGAPWRRVTKPTPEYQATLERLRSDPAWKGARRAEAIAIGNAFGSRATREPAGYQTLGWEPGCACPPAEPVPCVVLDPFGGSGTTGLVADRLGRSAVLIELNPEYAEMARRRIADDAPMLTNGAVTVAVPEQVGLFDEVSA